MQLLLSNCFKRKAQNQIFWGAAILILIFAFQLNAQLADGHKKYLGNIIGYVSIPPLGFDDYWNQVTAENAGKWGSAEASRDHMDLTHLDNIYQYALDNDFPYRHHNLIWGQQQPNWMDNLSEDEQREEVEEWIQLVGERYPEADYIDVVNEPINSPPSYKEALGGAGTTGYDWIIWTFEKAREYCPNAELHINEYGILNGGTSIVTYLKIINLLKDRGLIDGIGVQGHFLESATKKQVPYYLDKLAETGLPIHVTEYDVRIENDAQQEAKMAEQFPLIWEHEAVAGVTLWGYIQGYIWRTEAFLIYTDGSERPAMEWLWNYFEEHTDVPEVIITQPADFSLSQNYPNPFNPETSIQYQMQESGDVKLEIFDMTGRKIRTLVNRHSSAGSHTVLWNATDETGSRVASGIYVYQITIKNPSRTFSESRKMLLIK